MLIPAGLLPHAGAMCLLEEIVSCDDAGVICTARSHLHPGNGALRGDARPGFAAALRDLRFGAARLDDPAHGALTVSATREMRDAAGSIYAFTVRSETGRTLLDGRATIVTPAA